MRSKGIEHLLGECVRERLSPNQTDLRRNYASASQVSSGEAMLAARGEVFELFRDCILSRSH
jgi:hypothetical protein